MTTPLNVLGICGSLRQASYNAAALRVAQALAPEVGMSITSADIADLPLYNEDLRADGFPAAVERLREQIRAADALLFVTPEYNYSIPGVIKNAIDWASRPPEQPFAGKPAAIMGASPGAIGTARAQYHLRQVLVFLDVHPLNKPEVMIGAAHERFDAQGQLIHEPTREFIAKMLAALAAWTRQLAKP
jgi:chromate reductase